ncbi:MAG: hypothetical protein SFX73_10920 [Kofleriaceae bacterium]|nr:hypothetical protein [Kofleriaceae bacterium]
MHASVRVDRGHEAHAPFDAHPSELAVAALEVASDEVQTEVRDVLGGGIDAAEGCDVLLGGVEHRLAGIPRPVDASERDVLQDGFGCPRYAPSELLGREREGMRMRRLQQGRRAFACEHGLPLCLERCERVLGDIASAGCFGARACSGDDRPAHLLRMSAWDGENGAKERNDQREE